MMKSKMKKRIIGAHNALTAYRPLNWWAWLAAFVWRCQTRKPVELLTEGVTLFDWRVCRHKGRWLGAHGVVTLDVHALPLLDDLVIAADGRPLVFRLILERGNADDRAAFRMLCETLERRYSEKNVQFIGGNLKPTWEKLYTFAGDNIGDAIEQRVGSMDARHPWGKLFPWLWCKLYDRESDESADPRPLLKDFI